MTLRSARRQMVRAIWQCADIIWQWMCQNQADAAIQFINVTHRGDTWVVFIEATSIRKSSGAIVPSTRCNF